MPESNDQLHLIRLSVRLPSPAFARLKQEAQTNAVPMSALVRMLVVKWATERASDAGSGR